MRIWLITVADPIPSDYMRPMRVMQVADQAIARGHEVTIWTTSFSHHLKRQRVHQDTEYQVQTNYRVVVLKSWGYRKNISLQRYLAHWHFAKRLSHAFENAKTYPDIVIATLPPLDTVLAAVTFCQKQGIPVVVDVIDPWPDGILSLAPKALRPLAKLLLVPLYRQAKRIFSSVSAITGISQTYVEWGLQLSGRKNIPTWVFWPAADVKFYNSEDDQACRDRLGIPLKKNIRQGSRSPDGAGGVERGRRQGSQWDSAFSMAREARSPTVLNDTHELDVVRFVYAGALGRSYDVETVVKAARLLNSQGEKRAHFEIAGTGPKAELIHSMASELPNVSLYGWLDAKALLALLKRSHVGLAPYTKDSTQTVTYKLFEYLAAGLPILCSLPGEMTDFIVKHRVGRFFEPGNAVALADLVSEILEDVSWLKDASRLARQVACKYGEKCVVYTKMVQVWETIAEDKVCLKGHIATKSSAL